MDDRKTQNQFEEVHKKVQERLARDRDTNQRDALNRKQKEEKANGELLDREADGKA
jgi:hypothetical protein